MPIIIESVSMESHSTTPPWKQEENRMAIEGKLGKSTGKRGGITILTFEFTIFQQQRLRKLSCTEITDYGGDR